MCSKSFYLIKRFFCCCPLRLGSLIIGYLGLIAHGLHLAASATNYEFMQSFTEYSMYQNDFSDSNCTSPNNHWSHFAFAAEYLSVTIAYHVISLFIHCALLWGLHTAKSEFILPWLIVTGFECITVICILTLGCIGYACSEGSQVETLFLLIGICLFSVGFLIYSFMCVNSYYNELRSMNTMEKEGKCYPPAYITTFIDDKKQNITDVIINQGAI